jgi:PEP-CTERM motif
MRLTKLAAAFAAASFIAFVGSAAPVAAQVVGTSNSTNCYPFACFAYDGGTQYQEVYYSAAFSGPTTIGKLSFYESHGGEMDDATYTVAFYYTHAPVDGLSESLADNEGTLISNFGKFTLGGAMPSVLSLTGSSFVYNPADGNLLMDVTVSDVTDVCAYCSSFESDYTGDVSSRAWSNSYGTAAGANALVTGFSAGVAGIPEPSAWALMVIGVGALGARLRRNRLGRTIAA